MLRISQLPHFIIRHDGHREELYLARAGGQIQWLSERITARFPTSKRIGIIYPTSGRLILLWLALLKANKEPCILQYPTEKISKDYWRDLICHTVQDCGLEGLIHGAEIAPFRPEELAPTLVVNNEIGEQPPGEDVIAEGAIIQLSSGTTGYKKGIRLTLAQMRQHVENYNQVMQLSAEDTVVSWLPLYHDMGFIACFVMPLMLNVPVVMLDPMVWVKRPELLFASISEHRGTICYLPNFGFEVMSRQPPAVSLATMRHWISCSEPTHVETMERFCQRTGVAPQNVSTCYGMAENVFAVSQSRGLKTFEIDGKRVISCGPPIPGTQIKIVAGELFVKSDTSLTAYVGTGEVRDPEGFYATGDLGLITAGEVVVSGRKRDVMVSAGKKYFLNDLDFAVGKIIPDAAGRIASLAVHNHNLGTETVTFLVERSRFWEPNDLPNISQSIRQATGIEACEVHFVPPSFLTKTSSGKINRKKTLADWKIHQQAQMRALGLSSQAENCGDRLATCIQASFPSLPKDIRLGEVLDSLGTVLMRLICGDHGVDFDPDVSVNGLLAQLDGPRQEASAKVFSIVALVDGIKLGFGGKRGFIDDQFIAKIEREVGTPVHVEHICAPPVSVLFSDLIFHDYFMPRDFGEKYGPFAALIQKIKQASLILIDDEDAFRLREYCVYPKLSHRFNYDPAADLLGHRLQAYTRNHHLLAREVVAGKDIPLEKITESINDLGGYLQSPIMKLAFHKQFSAYTKGWDYTQYRQYVSDEDYQTNPIDFDSIQTAILKFVRRHKTKARFATNLVAKPFVLKDLPHFCSFLFRREAIDYITNQYDSFCLAGLPSSVPYFEQRLKQLGKTYFRANTLNPESADFDCLIATGFSGEIKNAKPYYDFVSVNGRGGRPNRVSPEIEKHCPSLMAGDPLLIEKYQGWNGNEVPIGNYVLNLEASIRAVFASTDHYHQGLELLKQRHFAEAAAEFKQCLNQRSQVVATMHGTEIFKAGPRHGLALCLMNMKDAKGARQEFQKAIQEEPQSRAARFDYAQFLAAQKQPVEALNLLCALVQENTADIAAWIAGGQILLSGPELLATALQWTDGGLKIHPQNPQLAWQRAETLTLAAKCGEALPLWRMLQGSAHPAILAAQLICETIADDIQLVVPLHLESAVSGEFIKWCQRLKSYRAQTVLKAVNARQKTWQLTLPTAAQSIAQRPEKIGSTHHSPNARQELIGKP